MEAYLILVIFCAKCVWLIIYYPLVIWSYLETINLKVPQSHDTSKIDLGRITVCLVWNVYALIWKKKTDLRLVDQKASGEVLL